METPKFLREKPFKTKGKTMGPYKSERYFHYNNKIINYLLINWRVCLISHPLMMEYNYTLTQF